MKAGADGGTVGPAAFAFTSNGLTKAQMMVADFGSNFSGLSTATMQLTSSAAGVDVTIFLLDSVKYIVYSI